MMRKQCIPYIMFFFALGILGNTPLRADNILKILEGYGRDSIATFSTQGAQTDAAHAFNIILQPDGKLAVSKAEQYLNSSQSPVMKSYLCVMLADYAFVNNTYDVGLRYMKRAVDEHDPIRNDSYYRLVLSRAQKVINESPGKTAEHKKSVLTPYELLAIKEEPAVIIKAIEKAPETVPKTQPENIIPEPAPQPIPEKRINFLIQVGAFSSQDNAIRRKDYFEKQEFPVRIDTREGSSGTLYLVRIGAYETYDEAKHALSEFKDSYPAEDGIVIKVPKK
ncbi:MAG: SPOR domain-containing protein [Candidatus Marinimicrobia bacterium]|nr:SPOR domain-containing protein [Candidatus Neomarinimicrobiota bacterium]